MTLDRGGVYLARLDPVKGAEIGKLRPIVVLTAQLILEEDPPLVFCCPLSSQSVSSFKALHIELPPRDRLLVTSYAMVEHCRSIATRRILSPRIAQVREEEIEKVLMAFTRLIDFVPGLRA